MGLDVSDLQPIPPGSRISSHLSWAEATTTQHRKFMAEQANPPPLVRANLRRLALDIFEPAREITGPLLVTSGYRCPTLNKIIGGSKTSAHPEGRALDVIPMQLEVHDAFKRLAASAVPFDQLIFEQVGGVAWIHMGGARHAEEPRRQRLMSFDGKTFEQWSPRDRRFIEAA